MGVHCESLGATQNRNSELCHLPCFLTEVWMPLKRERGFRFLMRCKFVV